MDKDLQRSVYEPLWQVTRIRCKGRWGTVEGTRENIELLKSYLGSMTTSVKTRRVINLLNMVQRGYRSRQVFDAGQKEYLVGDFLEHIKGLEEVQDDVATSTSEEEEAERVKAIWRTIPAGVKYKILQDLQHRLDLHSNEPREELRRFLDIVREHK